jgi:hypothetical protein
VGATVGLRVGAGEEAVVMGVGQLQPSGHHDEVHDDQEEDADSAAPAMDESSRARLLILLVVGVVVVLGAVGMAVAPRRRRETHMMLVLCGDRKTLDARLGEASGGGICVIPRLLACLCEENGNF